MDLSKLLGIPKSLYCKGLLRFPQGGGCESHTNPICESHTKSFVSLIPSRSQKT